MTLIIGIKCKDGVVLGADGAATFSMSGQATIRLEVKKKLQLLDSQAVVGVSGAVGIGQRIGAEVDRIIRDGIPDRSVAHTPLRLLGEYTPTEAMRDLREIVWDIIRPEHEIAHQFAGAAGNPALIERCLTHTLLCCIVKTGPCLIHFDETGAPTLVTENLPFVAIGNGQRIADPFLAFIRRIYWPDSSLPDVKRGVFSVIWALHHAIQTHPGGVGMPMQIVTFQTRQDTWIADDMPEDRWQKVLEELKDIEKRMASLPSGRADDGQFPVQQPPSPEEGS